MLKKVFEQEKGKISSLVIGVVIIVLVLIGGVFVFQNNSQSNQETNTKAEEAAQLKASVEISYNQDKTDIFADVEIEEEMTALDLTKKVVEVETSGEGEMAFVTKIKDTRADSSKNEFWELLINGEAAQIGAGSYKVKDGDKVAWKISTF